MKKCKWKVLYNQQMEWNRHLKGVNGLASYNINIHIIEGINNDDEEGDIQKDYHDEVNPIMDITKDIITGIFQS